MVFFSWMGICIESEQGVYHLSEKYPSNKLSTSQNIWVTLYKTATGIASGIVLPLKYHKVSTRIYFNCFCFSNTVA